MSRSLLIAAFILSLPRFAAASHLLGCASIGPRNTPVGIATESAIIIWDEENKVQHFIRRASFRTAADHFGFLVPTPTRPELKEAEDAAFDVLSEITRPRVEQRKRPGGCGCAIGCGKASDRAAGYIRTGMFTSESLRKPFQVGLTVAV